MGRALVILLTQIRYFRWHRVKAHGPIHFMSYIIYMPLLSFQVKIYSVLLKSVIYLKITKCMDNISIIAGCKETWKAVISLSLRHSLGLLLFLALLDIF